MKPSVGRVVHYTSYGTPNGEYTSQCRAAIVTAVGDTMKWAPDDREATVVSLAVLNPTGMFFDQDVNECHAEVNRGGTWHWPEREPSDPAQIARISRELQKITDRNGRR